MELDEAQQHALEAAASKARALAYAPYSQFRVGAALWLTGDRIVTGGNVENAAYGLTLCAERAALVAALAQGATKGAMGALVVAADAQQMTAPCGACRQVLLELCPHELPVTLYNVRDRSRKTYTVGALLPHAFGPETLASGTL